MTRDKDSAHTAHIVCQSALEVGPVVVHDRVVGVQEAWAHRGVLQGEWVCVKMVRQHKLTVNARLG